MENKRTPYPTRSILITSEKSLETVAQVLRYLPIDNKKPIEIVIREKVKNRTLSQNRLMHKWFSSIANFAFESTGIKHSEKKWKWFFKDLYLGYESEEMPNGRYVSQLRSTADCSTKELTEFLEKIDMHCVEMGLILPKPEDLYYEAMGLKKVI